MIENKLKHIYELLLERFGHRRWWPANSPFEVCVGGILTQNTSWKNVEKAIANLKDAELLNVFGLHEISLDDLAALIRPAGYFNVKSRRLKNFINHLVERHGGSLDMMFEASVEDLRGELLGINGVGRETADSMILYAACKPTFVIDAYTKRVLERHRLIDPAADYDDLQKIFHSCLALDVALYNDFHAQFVAVGSNYCGRKPKCSRCPLESLGKWD